MKPITIQVTKFQANDGRVFDTEDQCTHHEKRVSGHIKTCPNCNGIGEVDPYGDGRTFIPCSKCGGKGYVEKQEIWC